MTTKHIANPQNEDHLTSGQERSTYRPLSSARELADVTDRVTERAREPHFNRHSTDLEELMTNISRGFIAGPSIPSTIPAAPPDVGLVDVAPATAERARRQRQAEGLRSRAAEVAAQHPAPQPVPTPAPTPTSREAATSTRTAPSPATGASTSTPSKVPTPTPGPDEVVIPKSDYAVLMRAADAQLKAEEAAERRRIEDLRSGRQSFALDRIRGHRAAPRSVGPKTTGRNRR